MPQTNEKHMDHHNHENRFNLTHFLRETHPTGGSFFAWTCYIIEQKYKKKRGEKG